MKRALIVAAVIGAVLSVPGVAWGNGWGPEQEITPKPAPGSEECNLCSLAPETLSELIQACQAQPDGAACDVIRALAGAPITQA